MKTYTHTQSTPAAIWTIDHNLDLSSMMIETVVGTDPNPVLPLKITKTSENQVVVIFSTARSGTARIFGSSGLFVDYSNFVTPKERSIDYTHNPAV